MTSENSSVRVPSYLEMLNPTLQAMRELGGSATNEEIASKIIQILDLPPPVVDAPHKNGNMTSLKYNLAWTRTYLKKYGMIDNSERGVWSLTVDGRQVKQVDPNEVRRWVLARRKDSGEPVDDRKDVPEDDSLAWKEELLDAIRGMPPDAFERLCQRLLRESGFIEVKVTPPSRDGGVDGHGIIRLAGLISFPVLFQCKRYQGTVGSKEVRDFRGAMVGRADKGVIITTSSFTDGAQKEATRDGTPPIDLIDGELLADLLKERELGVTTRTVVEVEFFDSI